MAFMREQYEKEEKWQDGAKERSKFRPKTSAGDLLPGKDNVNYGGEPGASARTSARQSARERLDTVRSMRDLAGGEDGVGKTGRTGRTGRMTFRPETVRSDWSTARVEGTMHKLMDEKSDLMQRLKDVESMLIAEEKEAAKTAMIVKGRRKG